MRVSEDFAGLAGRLEGSQDGRPALVLLHGLTFDRTMWQPALAELRRIDPGRQALVLDLPGHGGSPTWPGYDFDSVAAAVHAAVAQAGLTRPVIVGHSLGGMVATAYAACYPASGVVNVDGWLQIEPLAALIQSVADEIRGGGFAAAWQVFEASMHMELLSRAAGDLLRSGRCLRQELVAGYWRQIMDRPLPELTAYVDSKIAAVRAAGIPYLFIAGHQAGAGYRAWLTEALPGSRIAVLADSGHFPHLAHPARFARYLASAAQLEGAA
jgi:pimeloyl-ACP methyl ester carboxylesterase